MAMATDACWEEHFVELGIYVTNHVFLCLTSVIIVYMTTTRPIRRIMVQNT